VRLIIKNMVKSVNLKTHRMGDSIVKDSISALNFLEEERQVKGRIAGGMAVQAYTPCDSHRKTIDLDIDFPFQGSSTEFREFCLPLQKYLTNLGYGLDFKKKGYSYEFHLNKDGKKGKDSFVIQNPSRSKNHFAKIKKSLEREINNRRVISRDGIKYKVISPEDLVAIKTHRALIFLDRYNLKLPKDISINGLRENSRKLREEIVYNSPDLNPRDVASLRLLNDLYDTRSLSHQVGLNQHYFSEVAKDWEASKINKNDFYALLDNLEVSLD
jgi:hypothetical protein